MPEELDPKPVGQRTQDDVIAAMEQLVDLDRTRPDCIDVKHLEDEWSK